jgi:hypothetical protein
MQPPVSYGRCQRAGHLRCHIRSADSFASPPPYPPPPLQPLASTSLLFKHPTPLAVLATAAVADDFGWGSGGRWSSPTVSYRERAFAYVITNPHPKVKTCHTLCSYGRLPTHSSRREFGTTDTERSTAVAIEAALRPFARAHVALTLLSSDGTMAPSTQLNSTTHPPIQCTCPCALERNVCVRLLQAPPTPSASRRMRRLRQLCLRSPATARRSRSRLPAPPQLSSTAGETHENPVMFCVD